jgi:hypothetical protein
VGESLGLAKAENGTKRKMVQYEVRRSEEETKDV